MIVNKLFVIGAGLFSEEITDLIAMSGKFEIVAFIEGIDPEKCRNHKFGKPIVWIEEIKSLDKSIPCICAIGSPERKKIINRIYCEGFAFETIIHPSAQVFPTASILDGSIVGAGSIIGAGATVGKQIIINRGCLIGHHTQIHDFVTISPGANIAGKVRIGESSFIGMGAIVLDGIKIGEGSLVGAGALVTKNIPDKVQVMGIPARITKELK